MWGHTVDVFSAGNFRNHNIRICSADNILTIVVDWLPENYQKKWINQMEFSVVLGSVLSVASLHSWIYAARLASDQQQHVTHVDKSRYNSVCNSSWRRNSSYMVHHIYDHWLRIDGGQYKLLYIFTVKRLLERLLINCIITDNMYNSSICTLLRCSGRRSYFPRHLEYYYSVEWVVRTNIIILVRMYTGYSPEYRVQSLAYICCTQANPCRPLEEFFMRHSSEWRM